MVDGAVPAHRAGTSADRIVFLGHSTVLIEVGGVRLLTDPLLRRRVVHLRRQVPAVDPDATSGLGAVLISHVHQDHLDLASLRLLGRDTRMLVPAGAGAWLRRRHFSRVRELPVGETADVGAVAVTAVEARHDGRRRPRGPRAEAVGYLVRGRSAVYFAGDTELFEGMRKQLPRLDAALLPVAGWGPTVGPGHMGPLDAARAAQLLLPRLAIPVHWGTMLPLGSAGRQRALLSDPPREFAENVARLAPGVEVRILSPGQETSL
jgi:L-ascorbate metabolism protein UlaG (beta-lactamase superfamily)